MLGMLQLPLSILTCTTKMASSSQVLQGDSLHQYQHQELEQSDAYRAVGVTKHNLCPLRQDRVGSVFIAGKQTVFMLETPH